MPEKSSSKKTVAPPDAPSHVSSHQWVELQAMSNFSLLRGGSHPEELIFEASRLGTRALGLTDLNTLAGIVRAHAAAKSTGLRFIAGARLTLFVIASPKGEAIPLVPTGRMLEGLSMFSVLVYPTTREGYGRLCSILTTGKRRARKGGCFLTLDDFLEHQKDMVCVLIPPVFDSLQNETGLLVPEFLDAGAPELRPGRSVRDFTDALSMFCAVVPRDYLSIAFTRNYEGVAAREIEEVKKISERFGIPLVAANDIHYHQAARKPLQDTLTCIRNRCSLQEAGFRLAKNANRHLKAPEEIARLYRHEPKAIARALEITEMTSGFSLDLLRYEYPNEICPEGRSSLDYLKELTWQGARERYPDGVSAKVQGLLEQEFSLIKDLQYEKYFLTCHDIVRYARSQGILCQGRGAAANSAVCYCLGITSVDPERIDILFARFVSKERNEPPDIDIDFEHERREEVIQYIYAKYGRHRAGLTAEVITYRHRSAIRDVGKALGLSLEVVDVMAKSIHRWTSYEIPHDAIRELGLDPDDPTIRNTLILSQELLGFPRHLSQHVGGFIISLQPLSETVPIMNAGMPDRTIIEWDKDDIDALGMLKIDVLGLGMLSCIRKGLEYVNATRAREGQHALALHTIPPEDPKVYDMVCEADTVGVFQIESRAQMSMLPRLKPRCFYDLVIEVAIVRPGPIHGNMVHPYLRRRSGEEAVHFPDEEVKTILGKTLGVPLFQEQAMRLAIVLAEFTPGEAEKLRRAMAAWKKNKSLIESFKERIVKGMREKGYTEQFAETCVNQIKGFSEYGFPESHAASFALLVYASAWIKRHYPVEFTAGLLNSQPMGFYAPSQIVRDLEAHGGSVLPIDVNYSNWDCTVEAAPQGSRDLRSLRLGMRLISGLRQQQADCIAALIKTGGRIASIRELWLRAFDARIPLRKAALLRLARADAFQSMGLGRRDAIWEIKGLPEEVLPLDPYEEKVSRELPALKPIPLQQSMFHDYETTGLSLKAHPIAFLREELQKRRAFTAAELRVLKKGAGKVHVSAGGLAIVRQRPGTANGVIFITLEDETGSFNLIVRPKVFEEYKSLVLSSTTLVAYGLFEKVGPLPYINVHRLESLDEVLEHRDIDFPSKSYSY